MKSDNQKSTPNTPKIPNKLVGWLVSYQTNERGSYYEIRSGRCFLGSGVVQGERLISFDPKDLRTAHAVLNASTQHRVVIQDIFSDSGTFVTKSSSGEEISVSGPTELEHGDWLRVGENTRFQLCLIDGGSK